MKPGKFNAETRSAESEERKIGKKEQRKNKTRV